MESPCIQKDRKVSSLCPPGCVALHTAFDLFVVIRSVSLVGGSGAQCFNSSLLERSSSSLLIASCIKCILRPPPTRSGICCEFICGLYWYTAKESICVSKLTGLRFSQMFINILKLSSAQPSQETAVGF